MAKSRSKAGQEPGKPAPKPAKDRRQEILAAAAQVITDRGLAETRIQDIAETCGVSTGLILYYFESKDRLLVEALTYANDQFYLRLSRELRKNPSAHEQLDRLLRSLSQREEQILRIRYGFYDGVARTLAQTGEHFGISRERVRQIEARALEKLRRALEYQELERTTGTSIH